MDLLKNYNSYNYGYMRGPEMSNASMHMDYFVTTQLITFAACYYIKL